VVGQQSTTNMVERGTCSYYGDAFQGKPTASGEPFDKNAMTAAHKTLPFQTWIRVTNTSNGKTVDVRINDRGPSPQDRILDLSEGSFAKVEELGKGLFDGSYVIL